jgi:predicted nuclease of predicted toxin-antitoxin system
MRFLADENIYGGIVTWLRSTGHDVLYAAEELSGEPDDVVAERCESEDRVLITHDKGFGERAVRLDFAPTGILLLRLGTETGIGCLMRLQLAWPTLERALLGNLLTITATTLRVRKLGPS